jgi:hypothetical protein
MHQVHDCLPREHHEEKPVVFVSDPAMAIEV